VNASAGRCANAAGKAPVRGKAAAKRRRRRLLARRAAVAAACCLLLAVIGFIGFDAVRYNGVIHPGVTVAGIDLGGLSVEEASTRIDEELSARAAAMPVAVLGDAEAARLAQDGQAVDLSGGVSSYEAAWGGSEGDRAWLISAATVGLSVDGRALAQAAWEVGRGLDFMPGRIAATFLGVPIPCSFEYASSQMALLEQRITASLGWQPQDSDIVAGEHGFEVIVGKDGLTVDHQAFAKALDLAFAGQEREVVVPMAVSPMPVSADDAAALAKRLEAGTAQELTLVCGQDERTFSSAEMRAWLSTRHSPEDPSSAPALDADGGSLGRKTVLEAYVDAEKLQAALVPAFGDALSYSPPINARFESDGAGGLRIVEGVNGSGIDFYRLSLIIEGAVLEPGASRRIVAPAGDIAPEFTADAARSLGVSQRIATFTTMYADSTANRAHNIHLASDYISGSLIAPGGVWSFNASMGECTSQRGFVQDVAILNNELVDEIGGGICQVASTVFNAAYELGLPIIERTNHALYVSYYPDGRDSTIAWPTVDLKFQNSTDDWMVLIMDHTGYSLTASLWGVDPGYEVVIEKGEWQEGEKYKTREAPNPEMPIGERQVRTAGRDGKAISVTRTVYGPDGGLLRQAVMKSWYNPVDEVVEVGTKPPPESDAAAGGTDAALAADAGSAADAHAGAGLAADALAADGLGKDA
jgi:vancomycin resistance protein YoaR